MLIGLFRFARARTFESVEAHSPGMEPYLFTWGEDSLFQYNQVLLTTRVKDLIE